MIAVLGASAIAVLGSVLLLRAIGTSFRSTASTKFRDDLNHIRNILYQSLDGRATLQPFIDAHPDFYTNSQKYCSTDLNEMRNEYLIEPRDANGNSLYDEYNPDSGYGRIGHHDLKTSCFQKTYQPSGTVVFCVHFHAAMLDRAMASKMPDTPPPPAGHADEAFRSDPRTKQSLAWQPLLNYPMCVREVGTAPGPGPTAGPGP